MIDRREVIGGIAALPFAGSAGAALTRRSHPWSAAKALERAKSAIGHGTPYTANSGGWPVGAETPDWSKGSDCSAFIEWCFGIDRYPPELSPLPHDTKLGTNAIYDDATKKHLFFRQIPRAELGCIVVYPDYNIAPDIGDQGHVGIVVDVKPITKSSRWKGTIWEEEYFTIIDCSGTAYHTFGDAIRENDRTKFYLHDQLMTEARRRDSLMKLKPDEKRANAQRSPIFARVVSSPGG